MITAIIIYSVDLITSVMNIDNEAEMKTGDKGNFRLNLRLETAGITLALAKVDFVTVFCFKKRLPVFEIYFESS